MTKVWSAAMVMVAVRPVAHQSPNAHVLARTVAACTWASTSTGWTFRALPQPKPLRPFQQRSPGFSLPKRNAVTRFQSDWGLQARRTRDAMDEELLDEEGMGGGLSEILSLLGFGFPAMILGGLWLFGQLPVTLLVSLAVIPALQKAAGPAISGLWRMMNPPKRQSRQRWKRSQYRDRGGKTFYSSPSRVEETADGSTEDGLQCPEGPGKAVETGLSSSDQAPSTVAGWDQPVTKPAQTQSGEGMRSRTRPRPSSSSSAPVARPRQGISLFLRLIIALFPFLRSWGGFL